MIYIANKRKDELKADNIYFLQSTIFDENLVIGSFDMVIAFNVLHLLENVPSVIQRINQLLKNGGYFVSLTPCIAQRKIINTLLLVISKFGLLPEINRFKTKELIEVIENNNFQILENITIDNNPFEYFIIAQK